MAVPASEPMGRRWSLGLACTPSYVVSKRQRGQLVLARRRRQDFAHGRRGRSNAYVLLVLRLPFGCHTMHFFEQSQGCFDAESNRCPSAELQRRPDASLLTHTPP